YVATPHPARTSSVPPSPARGEGRKRRRQDCSRGVSNSSRLGSPFNFLTRSDFRQRFTPPPIAAQRPIAPYQMISLDGQPFRSHSNANASAGKNAPQAAPFSKSSM